MKITELSVRNFGGLKGQRLRFADGVNVIYGPNESGKSTLHALIGAMFFGLPRARGRASRSDAYSRYEPWDNPTDYAAVLRFEAGGKIFRVSRSFYKRDVRESLICETDGEELSIEQGDLSMLLGQIGETVYQNTLSIGQMRARTDGAMVRELQNYMVNLETGGQGDVDVAKAAETLKKKKREWEKRLKEERGRQEESRTAMEERRSRLEREALALGQQAEDLRGGRARRAASAVRRALCGTAFLLAALFFFLWNPAFLPAAVRMAAALCALAAGAACLVSAYRMRGSVSILQGREEILRQQIREKQTEAENVGESLAEQGTDTPEAAACLLEIRSLELAGRTLEEISGGMRQRIASGLERRMEEIFCAVTEGKYPRLRTNAKLDIELFNGERWVAADQVSRGTLEQAYFALRLAMGDMIGEERLPVLLDETFASYDEKRLKQTLRYLASRGGQVILFTCRRREEELLAKLGIPANVISLEQRFFAK